MNRLKVLLSNNSFGMLLLFLVLFLHTGTVNTASLPADHASFAQFNQWCKDIKTNFEFCKGDECNKGINAEGECEMVLPFDYDSMSEVQRLFACDYYSPFGVSNATMDPDGDILCEYQTMFYCPKGKQIGNNCFLMSEVPNTYELVQCPAGFKMIKGNSQKENRWATILLEHNGKPVWVNGSVEVEDIQGRNQTIKKRESRNAMYTRANGFDGQEAQTLDNLKDNTPFHAMCYEQAKRIPLEQLMDSGKLQFMVTNNVVQPDGTPEKPNVNKYHEYCNKVFPGSIAAHPDHITEYLGKPKTEKIVHVAGQYKNDAKRDPNNDCATLMKTTAIRTRLATINSRGQEEGILDTSWVDKKFPNNKCADTFRSILTIHDNKMMRGLVDEPATARHKLLCVRGSTLVPVSTTRCGGRAVPDGQDSCKCKDGYMDGLDIGTFASRHYYQRGELCYESNCVNIQKTMHVIMMIDISYSEEGPPCNQAKGYFKKIPKLIPDTAKIDLVRWCWVQEVDEFLPSNDRLDRLNQLIAGEQCQGSGTSPQPAMEKAYELFKKADADANKVTDIKILISTTDGEGDYDRAWVKEKLIDEQKVHIIVVHNGPFDYNAEKLQQLVNPGTVSTNYVRIGRNDHQGMSDNHFKMVMTRQCNPDLDEIS